MTQPARRQASHADQARRADATATSATPPAAAHAIAAEAASKAPKCPACLLAHTVLHPYGWAKQRERHQHQMALRRRDVEGADRLAMACDRNVCKWHCNGHQLRVLRRAMSSRLAARAAARSWSRSARLSRSCWFSLARRITCCLSWPMSSGCPRPDRARPARREPRRGSAQAGGCGLPGGRSVRGRQRSTARQARRRHAHRGPISRPDPQAMSSGSRPGSLTGCGMPDQPVHRHTTQSVVSSVSATGSKAARRWRRRILRDRGRRAARRPTGLV